MKVSLTAVLHCFVGHTQPSWKGAHTHTHTRTHTAIGSVIMVYRLPCANSQALQIICGWPTVHDPQPAGHGVSHCDTADGGC